MKKKDGLVRFGVAMESSLLRAFDALVKRRGSTRSEALRDLARAEVTRPPARLHVHLHEHAHEGAHHHRDHDHHHRDEHAKRHQHPIGEQPRRLGRRPR